MQYVGVASSVALPLQVPLMLRSLADSLAFVPVSDLPINIDKDFLSWMGSIPYAHIPEHGMNWWASKAARKLPGHHLKASTLDLCLEIYRQTHTNVRPRITLTPPAKPLPTARCTSCREMRVLYIQAAESLISMRDTAAANRDIMLAHGEMGRRRMAAAYELMELSQMKETLIPDPHMSTVAVASFDALDMPTSTVAAAPQPARPTGYVTATATATVAQDLGANTATGDVTAAGDAPPAQDLGGNTATGNVTTAETAPAAQHVLLNTESQWVFGPALTAQEIIKRLGTASRRGRTWNMRSGQWHSGYFWALPEGKLNESGCSTAHNSVGAPHTSNFSETSKAATQEPPPTTYGFPDKFSSQNFRHTPPATIQNTATGSTPSGPLAPGAIGFLDMFGPRTGSTAATVRPSRAPETSALTEMAAETVQHSRQLETMVPPRQPEISAPGANTAAQGPTPHMPYLATKVFRMFGPPTVAEPADPPAVALAVSDSMHAPPAISAPSAGPPADRAADSDSPFSLAYAPAPMAASGSRPAIGVLDMFGFTTAPPASVPAPIPKSEQVPSAAPTSAAPPTPAVFEMFGPFNAQPASVPPSITKSEQVPSTASISAAPPAPAVFNMFGSYTAPPASAPLSVAASMPAPMPAAMTATITNPQQVSPVPATYGPPALGVFDMFGQWAGQSATISSSGSGLTPALTSGPADASSTERLSFFKMFDNGSAAGSSYPTKVAAPSVSDMYGTDICPSPSQPSPEQLDAAGLYIPPPSGALPKNTPSKMGVFQMFGPPSTGGQVRLPL